MRTACPAILVCLVIGCTHAQSVAKRAGERPSWWPATPAAQRLANLMAAYNTGSEQRLREFVRENYAPTLSQRAVERTAAYWLSVYREFGPVTSFQLYASEPRMTEIWARGSISEAWLTLLIEVDTTNQHRISGAGVGRGIKPAGVAATPISTNALARTLREYLARLDANDLFSGSVVVLRDDGTLVFEGAAGYANREHRVRTTTQTRFYAASVGKMFTAAALLVLVDSGRIGLDDPISKHLPEIPAPMGTRITLRHLLTHTSGIELDDDSLYVRDVGRARTMRSLIATQLRYLPRLKGYPDLQPLTQFNYSNEGYDLIGAVIERVTGQEYHAAMRRLVFIPAGMTNSGEYTADTAEPGLATGYTNRDGILPGFIPGPRRHNVYWLEAYGRPSGGHFTTAADLARFLVALNNGRFLRKELVERAFAPQVDVSTAGERRESYGLGFQIQQHNGRRRIGHAGGIPGASARAEYYPQMKLVVVVLSNHDWVANNVADRIAELIGW